VEERKEPGNIEKCVKRKLLVKESATNVIEKNRGKVCLEFRRRFLDKNN
jgi:hypothetical protein